MKLPNLSLKNLSHLSKRALLISGTSVAVIGAGLTTTLIATQQQTGADPVSPIQIQVNQNTDDINGLKTTTEDLQTQVDNKQDKNSSSNTSSPSGSSTAVTSSGNTTQTGNQSTNPAGSGETGNPSTPTPTRTAFSKLVTLQSGSITATTAFPGYTNTSGANYLSNIGNGGEPYAVNIPVTRISGFICALDTGYLEDSTMARTYIYYGHGRSYSTTNLTVTLPGSVTGDICNYLYTHQRTQYVANGSYYYAADGSQQNAGQTLYLRSDSLADITLGTGSSTQIANPY